MRALLIGLSVVLLAGCATDAAKPPVQLPPVQQLPDGYPPKIGTVSARLGDVAQAWETFDYSIGAFDASVQVVNFNGQTQFRLMGEPPGKPDQNKNRLLIKADMTSAKQTGALTGTVIEIVAGKDWDGRRQTSLGSEVMLELTRLKPMGPQGEYGQVTGIFSTTLCEATGLPAKVNRAKCQPFTGTFTSDLQIGGP